MSSPGMSHLSVAAVDCGTNSTRLLILDGDRQRLERRTQITRLGAGVDRTGQLDEAAVERTLAVLAEYRSLIDRHGIEPGAGRVRAAATSATRDAENAVLFLEPAEQILGVRPEVIEGTEEGSLSYAGATADLDPHEGPYLVVDIGGGSTELIVGAERSATGTSVSPAEVTSLDIGCVRLTERHLSTDPPTSAEIATAHEAARAEISGVAARPEYQTARRLIGLAGTVSSLTVMVLGLDGFDERRVHHARVSRDDVGRLAWRLGSLSLAERKRLRGMEEARADVIVGGAIILEEVMDSFGFDELTASESDILDGIAFALLEQQPT